MLNQQLEFTLAPDLGNRARILLGHPVNRSAGPGGDQEIRRQQLDRVTGAYHISAILPSVLQNIKERQLKQ